MTEQVQTENDAQDIGNAMILQGRRHSRELMMTANRIAKLSGDKLSSSVVSTSLQLVLSTAIHDGHEANEAYDALVQTLVWAVSRVQPDKRQELLGVIVKSTVEGLKMIPDEERPAILLN